MLVNLTPHPIKIFAEGGKVEVPPSGITVRLNPEMKVVGGIKLAQDGKAIHIPIEEVEYKDLVFLKEGKEIPTEEAVEGIRKGHEVWETLFIIVPQLIAPKAEELAQLLAPCFIVAPNTNRAVRDENGRIIGVKSLLLLAKKI